MTSIVTSVGKLRNAQRHVPDSSSYHSLWDCVMGKDLYGLYFTVCLLQGPGYIARAGPHGARRATQGPPLVTEARLDTNKAVLQVGGGGYPLDFSPSYEKKMRADALLLRGSWQPCVLPYRPM